MTQGRSRTGRQPGGYQRARIAVAALLVVMVAVGLRGSLPSPALDGPYSGEKLPVAAGLEAVVLGLLLAVALRTARAPRENSLATRLREVLRTILGAAALAVPALYLLTRHFHSHHRPPRPPQPTGSGAPRPLKPYQLPKVSGHAAGSLAGTVIDAVLAAGLLAAIVACVLLLLKGRRPPVPAWPAGPAELRGRRERGQAQEGGRVRLAGAARTRRCPRRHHRLLPGHGAEPGPGRRGPGHRRDPR